MLGRQGDVRAPVHQELQAFIVLKTKQNRESFREIWAWTWKGERNRGHVSVC